MPVLILTGPPGSGKTTVSRILANRRARSAHLESDLFFGFIQSGYVEPWKREAHGQNGAVMQIVATAAVGYARAGYFTIVDGIVIPGRFFGPLRDSLDAAGHDVAFAVLRAPLAECVKRCAGRGPRSLSDANVIEQLWHQFADLGDLERNVIEVTGTADETADLVAASLEAGALAV